MVLEKTCLAMGFARVEQERPLYSARAVAVVCLFFIPVRQPSISAHRKTKQKMKEMRNEMAHRMRKGKKAALCHPFC